MKSAGRWPVTCGVLALGVLPACSLAEDLSYGIDAGVGYDDNVTRSSVDQQEDTIASIGAQLRLDHESRRIKANIASRLEYRDYLNNTYDSEVVGNLIANSKFDLVEQRLTWVLDDTFGQSTVNQFAADTPANRENVNVVSTGPDLKLPLGTRNYLVIGGRYTDVGYQHSNLGNDRVDGQLALERELSAASVLSLNANTQQVRFDDSTLYPDFDRNEAFLGYELNVSRTRFSLEGGATEIRMNGQTDDGWLGRLEVSRKASEALTVGAKLGHEFSDAGASFVQQQALQPGSTNPVSVQQTATPFVNEYAELFGHFTRNRTDLNGRVGFYDETYDQQPLFDRRRLSIDVGVERTMSPTMVGRIHANYARNQYTEVDREFSDLNVTAGLSWQVGRLTSVDFDYTYVTRKDDAAPDYSSNQVWIRFGYLVGEGVSSGASASF